MSDQKQSTTSASSSAAASATATVAAKAEQKVTGDAAGIIGSRTPTKDSQIALQGLRKLMKENNIDAYVVPTADAHQVWRL